MNQFVLIFEALANNILPVQHPGSGVQNFVTMKNYIFLPGKCNSDFVDKDFLFTTSSRKIKSHVVESQITWLVWACLSLTLFIFIRTR